MEVWIHLSEDDWNFIAAACNEQIKYTDNQGKELRAVILKIAERLEIELDISEVK